MQNKTLLLAFVGLALSLPNASFARPAGLQPRAPPVIETLSDLVRGSRSGLRHRFTPMRSSEPEEIQLGEARPLRGGYVPGSGKRRMKKLALYGTGLAVVGTATGVGAHEIVQHEREQNRKLAVMRADLEKQAAALRDSKRNPSSGNEVNASTQEVNPQVALPNSNDTYYGAPRPYRSVPSPGAGHGAPPNLPGMSSAQAGPDQSVPSPGAGHGGPPGPLVVKDEAVQDALPDQSVPSPGAGHGGPPGPLVVKDEVVQDAFPAQSVPSPGTGNGLGPLAAKDDREALPSEAGPSPGTGNGKPPGPPVVQAKEGQDAETMGRKGGSPGSIPAPAAQKTPNPP
ncbi:hypothetical protein CBOM_00235 [Ceraceosorus bombacis]|uniref:Uncharacterized protein n=1 Tax=Ceraceosorus bombacis TaxID=401625 RepID=A0A0P1B9I4_9BASI|nr:hypothetical protein CBOM_00235 [Ceraceosorus bombacis]